MGTIRKKKTLALTRMTSIKGPDTLYTEVQAKALAIDLQIGDPDWKWEAVLVNPEKNLWAIQFTDENGNTERASF